MEIPLSSLKKGQSGKLKRIQDPILEQQLIAMGCIPGEDVMLENLAPFNDPIEIRVLEQFVSIRIIDAENIILDI